MSMAIKEESIIYNMYRLWQVVPKLATISQKNVPKQFSKAHKLLKIPSFTDFSQLTLYSKIKWTFISWENRKQLKNVLNSTCDFSSDFSNFRKWIHFWACLRNKQCFFKNISHKDFYLIKSVGNLPYN